MASDYLYIQPTFWRGAARVGDLWGTLDQYNTSATAIEADYRAIYSDWMAVGRDMASAIRTCQREGLDQERTGVLSDGDG